MTSPLRKIVRALWWRKYLAACQPVGWALGWRLEKQPSCRGCLDRFPVASSAGWLSPPLQKCFQVQSAEQKPTQLSVASNHATQTKELRPLMIRSVHIEVFYELQTFQGDCGVKVSTHLGLGRRVLGGAYIQSRISNGLVVVACIQSSCQRLSCICSSCLFGWSGLYNRLCRCWWTIPISWGGCPVCHQLFGSRM